MMTALFHSSCAAASHKDIDVVLLGDSNTHIGGDDCSDPSAWSKWFVDSFAPRSCRSYARSGATWTNTRGTRRDTADSISIIGDRNVIYNQVCRLTDAVAAGTQPRPRLIVIGAGTNDAWFLKRRPRALSLSAADVDTASLMSRPVGSLTTLAESASYCCSLLRSAFPDARIVLLTPLQTVKASKERIGAVADILTGVAARYGCDVIRQDRVCGIDSDAERRRFDMTTDGTHTSVKGARRAGETIAHIIGGTL